MVQLDVLEYMHDKEYVHADIKASNLLVGYTDPQQVTFLLTVLRCDDDDDDSDSNIVKLYVTEVTRRHSLNQTNVSSLTYLALRSSGPCQDNGQQDFTICSCL